MQKQAEQTEAWRVSLVADHPALAPRLEPLIQVVQCAMRCVMQCIGGAVRAGEMGGREVATETKNNQTAGSDAVAITQQHISPCSLCSCLIKQLVTKYYVDEK